MFCINEMNRSKPIKPERDKLLLLMRLEAAWMEPPPLNPRLWRPFLIYDVCGHVLGSRLPPMTFESQTAMMSHLSGLIVRGVCERECSDLTAAVNLLCCLNLSPRRRDPRPHVQWNVFTGGRGGGTY